MVTNIFDLKFKKDETFLNEHIFISKSGTMYMTLDFANYLCDMDLYNGGVGWYHMLKNNHYIRYGTYNNYRCSLFVRKFSFEMNSGLERFKCFLCGSTGSRGFGGLEHTKREVLGIRTVRRANKYIVDEYLKSHFSRYEKIKLLKEKMIK